MICDRATTALVQCFLFGGVAIGEGWTSGAFLVVFVLLLQGTDYDDRTFFSVIFLIFLDVCIRNAIRAMRCCRC
jgi:hypothetical protein